MDFFDGIFDFIEGLFKERLPQKMFWILLGSGIAFLLIFSFAKLIVG